MFVPVKLFFALRRYPDRGVLAAIMSVSVLFASTPFVIPAVAADYGVSIGRSGLLSAAQVGGFAVAAFVAGRRLRTHRGYLVGASLAAVLLNLASAVAPTFEVLLTLRVLAGVAGGLLVWLGWSRAMRDEGALRNVAAAGPLTVLVSSPLLAWLAVRYGSAAVYVALAVASMPAALLPAEFVGYRAERLRLSPSRSNVVLVVALGMATLAGSALFVYGAAIGLDVGLSAFVVSLGFSANALMGLIATRRRPDDRPGGWWIYGTALCAGLVAFGGNAVLFLVGISFWGFFFWMATPSILRSLAKWSRVPEERVGDAQSSMAVGRAIGPAVGSALVVDGSYEAAGVFSVVGLLIAGSVVLGVRYYRRHREPPVPAAMGDA